MAGEDRMVSETRVKEWAREPVVERVVRRQAARNDPEPLAAGQIERREVEVMLRLDRLIGRLTAKLGPPRNQDITEFYKKNRDSFYSPELVHAAHIVKNVDENHSEEAARAAIAEVAAELKAGAIFEELADLRSDCPGRGGNLD